MEEDDVDGEPMAEDNEDEDGEPMVEDEDEEVGDAGKKPDEEVDMFVKDSEIERKEPPKTDSKPMVSGVTLGSGFGFKIGGFGGKAGAGTGGTEEGRKKRMKAEDMFANDDSDG